jgi:hypothetical protein
VQSTDRSIYSLRFVSNYKNFNVDKYKKKISTIITSITTINIMYITNLTEPKCQFFAWTLLHNKILTANNLQKRGWNNDPICKLCKREPETVGHLAKDCIFTKSCWSWLSSWYNLSSLPKLDQCSSVYGWWRKCRLKVEKTARKEFDGLCIYFWWEIWKERNRRIFHGLEKREREVANFVKEDFNPQRASS